MLVECTPIESLNPDQLARLKVAVMTIGTQLLFASTQPTFQFEGLTFSMASVQALAKRQAAPLQQLFG